MTSSKIPALEISALAHDGTGLGFIERGSQGRGKAVFVRGALPGQLVSCEIFRDRGSFCEARLLEIISSPLQTDRPPCRHWHDCGGCPLQPMPYQAQLFWKEKLVRDAMERIGKFPPEELEIAWLRADGEAPMPSARNKVELAFGQDEAGKLVIGFRRRASHQVFQLQDCGLIPDSALPIMAECRQLALELDIRPQLPRFLTLRRASDCLWTAILLTGACKSQDRARVRRLGERLLERQPHLDQFLHEERKRRDLLAKGEKRICHLRKNDAKAPALAMDLCGRKFLIDPASFFQVNPKGAETLARAVLGADPGLGPLLDLYCGSGSPGQLLSGRHAKCLGIEQDDRAIRFARQNGSGLPNWRYVAGKVEDVLAQARIRSGEYPVVLADPPRAGMEQGVTERLLALAPQRIIHVSCNAATLARDGAVLKKAYKLRQIQLVDMFPDTPHVECCAVWQLEETGGSV